MGLYDTIQFQYKLPLPDNLVELTSAEIQSASFQTKSLDCGMTFYKVDESGQLFREWYEGHWTEGNKTSKSIFDKIGHFERTKEWVEPENYTGVVNFYQLYQSDKNKNDYWYEAEATFINGKISEIKLIKFEATDNAARKQRSAEFAARMKADYEWRNRWYIKYTYVPYERFIRWIFRKYHLMKQKLPPSYKIERFLTPW